MEGNHKDRNHALLSASGASRWMNCNPSARLEDMFPDCSSEYAEEGTLAHEISELKLLKYTTPMSQRAFNSKMKKLKSYKLYKPEMENYTDVYVDNIKELLMSFDKPGTAEIEKKVDFSEYVPEGFGTCDFVTVDNGTLYIRDLKYGKGVPVSAQDNPQLMLYSLGAYLEFSLFNDIENINMGIIQPRLDIVSIFEISADELVKWAENEVKPNAEKAFNGEGDFKIGQCTFCRAKAICRARAEANMSLETEMKLKGNILSNEEIGEILNRARDVVKWVKDIENYCQQAILRGEYVPGWKVVEGRSVRAFSDTEKAMEVLKEKGIAEELMYERKVLTLTQLEGVIGKKDFNEYVGDFIIKPKGKPTLVPESDKRAPYVNDVINASDDFINLDNNGKDD
ncbi:DUF2800 domain-containing protein [Leptotrichia sp. oral taxon 223]|uniref:DUF2800 domain-containing protein n=1 Tax=Leptotrichia sp. oral taxon 223 TaxID=712363 RepID=UPI0015C10703|nr:DUF2800 domain-containing protein [Leptotrichia sp. oral taxon 223]NWO20174.1 DUF2800 domain-containing protein [Leptotrichia sp. oral taxon 223]